MKSKLTEVFNQASTFFWYPPKDLISEEYIKMREQKIEENYYPG